MPGVLERRCAQMGCQYAAPCPIHTTSPQQGKRRSSITQRAFDDRRGSAASRGYDARWRKASKLYLQAHPLCRACQSRGHLTAASLVDHVTPHKGNYDLFWNEANWQPLCKPCHDTKTWQEARVEGARTVVCGPPGCGKSTWVKAKARIGDLVWDFDDIASAVGYKGQPIPREQRGPGLSFGLNRAVLAMREGFIGWLMTTPVYGADVYIIVSDQTSAALLASRVRAAIVDLGTGGESAVLSRATGTPRRALLHTRTESPRPGHGS